MELQLYLQPVSADLFPADAQSVRRKLVNTIEVYRANGPFPDLDHAGLAIIGVEEGRGNADNAGCAKAPDAIRKAFYELYCHWPDIKIVDLGNIKAGHSIEDTYFAIKTVVGQLVRNNITTIILGGSQDLTFANYQAYENTGQLINIVAVDPAFDLGQDEETLSAYSYLSKIIMHQPNYLFNYTNLGYQSYYIDADAVGLMNNMFFDVYRLGLVKSQPEETEPYVRNADMLSFDITAVRAADAPGNARPVPNGFTGEEACRICRYAGMSDKLSAIGFYEFNPSFDRQEITAGLIGQMIWYFIDGFAHRLNDLPTEGSRDFARYNVRIEGNEDDVVFLRSKKTDRWWIDLSSGRKDRKKYERHYFVPCSQKDYESALQDDIPDRWWQFYQKLM
ncbi:MAG: formimidoylglutamase [Bacteroidetes bacterium]|nr:formimidoylglutamase [Bacteroidota bacterium]